jgi:hypothetical protein
MRKGLKELCLVLAERFSHKVILAYSNVRAAPRPGVAPAQRPPRPHWIVFPETHR